MGRDTVRVSRLGKRFRRGVQKEGQRLEFFRRKAHYEYFWALKDVDFTVEQGQMLGVIGPNGAGKSTLLRIISRITCPTEGTVEITGRVGSLLSVGTGFHPELTGRENIVLNSTVLGIPRSVIRLQTDEIVSFSGIEEFIDTPLKYYSSGMKVRLGMAIALHLRQEIMLVDEVLSVGDASFREKCLDAISEVTRSGRTVLFVGHNMEMISSTCDRAIWLHKGAIRANGTAPEVVEEYQRSVFQKVSDREGFLPLEGRPDHGTGEGIRLTHLRLLDGMGNQIPSFRTGQAIRFAVGFEGDNRSKPPPLSISITILGQGRIAVGQCESSCVGDSFHTLPDQGEFICSMKRLPLLPGRYTLGLKCRSGETVLHGFANAGSFYVLDGDFYGTGVLPPPGGGHALLEYEWSVEERRGDPVTE